MTRALRANLLLLLTAAIWGFAFVAQRLGALSVGSFTLNAVRFMMGAAVLIPILMLQQGSLITTVRNQLTSATLRWGVMATGVVLFGAAALQQSGLESTTAGKAGFITGLYVVLVPLLSAARSRLFLAGSGENLTWRAGLSVLLAAAGLYLLSVNESMRMAQGDLLVFGGAFLWAMHVQLVGWLSRRMDPLILSTLQFLVCSALSGIAALLFDAAPFSGLGMVLIPILYAGFLSVGVAYSLQAVAQRDADPTPAALVMSLEAVFAALGGWMILGEGLSPRNVLGCGLMLTGMVLAQLPEGRLHRAA